MTHTIRMLIVAATLLFAAASSAQWVAGVGYTRLSDDDGDLDISLDAIVGSIGYGVPLSEDFQLVSELRLGIGVGDDEVLGVDIELDRLIVLSVRGQYDFDEYLYLFGGPSYANVELTASAAGLSATEDDWEFGIGVGGGFRFGEATSVELSYDTYDGTDAWALAFRFWFGDGGQR